MRDVFIIKADTGILLMLSGYLWLINAVSASSDDEAALSLTVSLSVLSVILLFSVGTRHLRNTSHLKSLFG